MNWTYQVFQIGTNGWLLTTDSLKQAEAKARRASRKAGHAWVVDCRNGNVIFQSKGGS